MEVVVVAVMVAAIGTLGVTSYQVAFQVKKEALVLGHSRRRGSPQP